MAAMYGSSCEVAGDLISAARGETEADLLLQGADVINVLSGRVRRSDLAIHRGFVVGSDCSSAACVLDLDGCLLAPGFVDSHIHLESAMVTPYQYARAVVPCGTTAVVADPHELANVLGVAGVRNLLDLSQDVPLNVFAMAPSCVPATDMETSGAQLGASQISLLLDDPRVLGLGEMMNFPGVLRRDPAVLEKIGMAAARGKPVDGHCPGLSGRDLAAYISAGIMSDHECTSLAEAEEKLSSGMHIMIREGSAAKNLDDLIGLVNPHNASRIMFCSDDRHPRDILEQGHIDSMVRRAIASGLDLVTAVQIASLNPARYFGIARIGALAPGFRADLLVLDDPDRLRVEKVFFGGSLVAAEGAAKFDLPMAKEDKPIQPSSMRVAALSPSSFDIQARGRVARVIGIVPGQITTRSLCLPVTSQNGLVVSDLGADLLKLAVVERHQASGRVGLGLVQGFGISSGALASSVAHDSHNIVVAGADSQDMLCAVQAVVNMGGGLVAVRGGKVLASLSLPIAGLLSDRPLSDVAAGIDKVVEAAQSLGSGLENPFMTLSFLALPVIPELKLTDRGLVDVVAFRPVSLFLEDGID
ncbi:MAG TPA: adenine deaminase [Methanotrichaceae archaeon]|nr:adenine deaminase [Methanotrichaceae archaeon]HQF17686.1 adenine deaminase [Methanotrichaceae archaeon]HQI92289.1 adenine deaminase [Methanotrichaceae archaeon]HQJ29382.1 adenine deaminase [Methanotrichaceae archaeon]